MAQIVAYSMVTNWLGNLWVGGTVLLWAPPTLAQAVLVSAGWLRAIGLVMIAATLAYLALCRFSPQRQLTWRGHRWGLASGRLATWQSAAGGANWLLIGVIDAAGGGGRCRDACGNPGGRHRPQGSAELALWTQRRRRQPVEGLDYRL